MLGPICRGQRVSLEPPELDDLPLVRAWSAEYDEVPYVETVSVRSLKQLGEWYDRVAADDTRVQWRIVADGRTVGMTGLMRIDWQHRHASSGLTIGEPAARGQGYASEAVQLRTAFAFRELGLERLESECYAGNEPMHRALEKAGYQKIGTKHHHYYRGGRWHNVYLFELLRDDWQARQA